MSEGYRIRASELVGARMSAWEIPADIRRLMEQRLSMDLCSSPADYLVPCKAPWDERLNLFTFSIPHSEDLRVKYTFLFHVGYSEDEKHLDIIDCGFIEVRMPPA